MPCVTDGRMGTLTVIELLCVKKLLTYTHKCNKQCVLSMKCSYWFGWQVELCIRFMKYWQTLLTLIFGATSRGVEDQALFGPTTLLMINEKNTPILSYLIFISLGETFKLSVYISLNCLSFLSLSLSSSQCDYKVAGPFNVIFTVELLTVNCLHGPHDRLLWHGRNQ